MKIVVLNGSPKMDKISCTMTFIRYIQCMFSSHTIKIINVGAKFVRMDMNEKSFQKIIDEIQESDGVIWAFPVYTMLIPAQLKRFIEFIWEKNVQSALEQKYSAVLSTSMNFYDHTAHNYMHAICEDLNMSYVGFHSAQMDDLLDPQKRKNFYLFFENFLYHIENALPVFNQYKSLNKSNFKYKPQPFPAKADNSKVKVTIITDCLDPSSNLSLMVNQLKKSFISPSNVEIINLYDINIKGGCLGCIKCGFDNQCVYKDEYSMFFREKIMNQPILIYAAEIKDRFFSHRWKLFFDRIFHNGHTPSLKGTQMGYLVSGPLSQIPNLRQIISAQAECGNANLVSVISDDRGDSTVIDASIQSLATNLIRYSEMKYVTTPTFLEVGGFKVFRDLIYGIGRIPFPSDYKYFKKNQMFDFPTKNHGILALGRLTSILFKSKKIRQIFRKKLGEGMIMRPERMLSKLNVKKELAMVQQIS